LSGRGSHEERLTVVAQVAPLGSAATFPGGTSSVKYPLAGGGADDTGVVVLVGVDVGEVAVAVAVAVVAAVVAAVVGAVVGAVVAAVVAAVVGAGATESRRE
jgi:hypothetical protein